jgi:hypothetical protein
MRKRYAGLAVDWAALAAPCLRERKGGGGSEHPKLHPLGQAPPEPHQPTKPWGRTMDRLYAARLVAKNDSMQGRSGPIQLKKYKDLNILKYLYFLNCIGPLLPCMRSFFATSLVPYNRSIVRPHVFVGCLATCHLRPRVALGLLLLRAILIAI